VIELAGRLLDGRTAVVTGAGDIGAVVARELRAHGARLVVWDRSAEALARLEAEVGDRVTTRVMDVTSAESVAAAAAETATVAGAPDVLVNTAAIATFAPVAEMPVEAWRHTIEVNLTGVFMTCRFLVPHMIGRRQGSIVNISSIGGLRGEPEFSHYCASKFGVIGFSQSLAQEVGEHGIRVNCVCPGAVESAMNTDTMARDARRLRVPIEEIQDRIVAKTALRRLATPRDVANAVVFFASDLSSFITGAALTVAGGIV
jgi:NAD(P)-dependent dehydrogenase (short-subunit alcohol dehydrogenase family)